MDPGAKGMFFGMTLANGPGHFLRSVMEGVTYSLKDCMEILEELGAEASGVIASGGGASSRLWLQIQADIFEKPVYVSKVKEHTDDFVDDDIFEEEESFSSAVSEVAEEVKEAGREAVSDAAETVEKAAEKVEETAENIKEAVDDSKES